MTQSKARVSREVRGWITASLVLAGFGVGAWATHTRKAHASHVAPPTVTAESTRVPEPEVPAGPTELTVVYSTETSAWLRAATSEFERANPGYRVRLQGMGTIEAERAIAEGRLHPTLWMPADTSAVEQLERDWRSTHSGSIVVREQGTWPRPLVLTPMVFAVWQSRARVLAEDRPTLSWSRIASVARSPRGWTSIGGDRAWGGMKFGHTDPSRSYSGLQALVLMAYGWQGRAGRLLPSDVNGAGFGEFMHALEGADPASDRGTTSSGEFAQTIAVQGPGRYDVVMLYEAQSIAVMDLARGRWGEELRVYYPTVNIWSDHPLALLDGGTLNASQRAGAERLAEHLRSQAVQSAAVRHGFRPADATVPLVNEDPENPFVKYRAQGVRIELTQVADAPSPEVMEALLGAWRRSTGR